MKHRTFDKECHSVAVSRLPRIPSEMWPPFAVSETHESSRVRVPRPVSIKGGRRMIEPHECDLDSSGEAARFVLRRPFRWDRAGLFYFGRRYAGWMLTLTSSELAAFANGRQILVAPGTEYLLLVRAVTYPS